MTARFESVLHAALWFGGAVVLIWTSPRAAQLVASLDGPLMVAGLFVAYGCIDVGRAVGPRKPAPERQA